MSGEESNLDRYKCGKWMHFFNNKKFAVHICEEAVANGICEEAKHTDAAEGVCCFYLNCDDNERHKRVLSYFIENDLIRKTKAGKLLQRILSNWHLDLPDCLAAALSSITVATDTTLSFALHLKQSFCVNVPKS